MNMSGLKFMKNNRPITNLASTASQAVSTIQTLITSAAANRDMTAHITGGCITLHAPGGGIHNIHRAIVSFLCSCLRILCRFRLSAFYRLGCCYPYIT